MSIPVTGGSGYNVATDTIATTEYQRIKIVGGETGSTSVLGVTPDGAIRVSIVGIPSISGTVNIGNTPSISGTVNIGNSPIIGGSVLTVLAPTGSIVSGVTSVMNQTTSVLLLAAAPGAQRNYVTNLLVTNNAGVSTQVSLVDSGLVIYSGFAGANGGGFSLTFPVPLKQPSTVTALYAVSNTQASVIVAATGYTAP